MAGTGSAPGELVFIGCYTVGAGGEGEGIVAAQRDPVDGALSAPRVVARTPAPSYLARHPHRPVLYAVADLESGAVTAYDVGPGGALTPRGSWPTGGVLPCHLAASDGVLYVANYESGSVAALPLGDDGLPDGRLDVEVHSGHGPDRERQQGPHAHMVVPTVDGLLAVDLGADRIFRHRYDGGWSQPAPAVVVPPGSGPRHLTRTADGRVHVVGELDAVITTYEASTVEWRLLSRVRCTTAATALASAIGTSADGRWLYVGNRGPDTLGVLDLRGPAPVLVAEASCGGAWPRDVAGTGGHLYVANERSHTVAVLAVDPDTGVPAPAGELATPSPTCVLLW